MTAYSLSPRQQRILEYIRAFVAENGYSPSIREILIGCDISSTSVVAYNLDALVRSGHITRRHGRSGTRTIRLWENGALGSDAQALREAARAVVQAWRLPGTTATGEAIARLEAAL